MKKFKFYFELPDGTKIWCIGPEKKNQVSSSKDAAGAFEVTGDIDEFKDHILDGFNEAWNSIPAYKTKPEWRGVKRDMITLHYQEVSDEGNL